MTQSVTTTSPHSSIRVRTNGPVTEINVRTPLARWYRACLWSILPTFAIVVPAVCVLSGHLPPSVRLVPVAAVAVFVVFLLLLAFLTFANIVTSASLLIDGQTLEIRPPGSRFSIPLRNIRGISLSTHPRRRLDIDPSAPPHRLFTLRRPVSLDIDTPAGRIRFLRGRTPSDLPPLLNTLSPLLNLSAAPSELPAPSVTVNSDANTRGGILAWRALAAVLVVVTAGLAYWELLPAFQSSHWPSVTGQMTRSHWECIDSEHSRGGPTYKVEAAYTYSVNHNTYANDRIGFGRDDPENAVRDYLLAHPAGSTAPVYYDPANPGRSTLIPGPGSLDWLFAGTTVVPLLLTLPLALRRVAPAEELALLARYRVNPRVTTEPRTIEDAAAPVTSNLPHWTTPLEAFERAYREQRRTFLFAGLRAFVALLVIECAFYAYFSPRLPFLFQSRALLWVFLATDLFGAGTIAALALVRGRPAELRLTPDGIRISTREKPLIRYASLHSFTLSHDPAPPHAITLHLHATSGHRRDIPLPHALATEIISTISQHLPERPPLPAHSPLRRSDWLVGLAATAAFAVAAGTFLRQYHGMPVAVMALFFVGPGTLIAPLFRRRRASVQLLPFAMVLNYIGAFASLLYCYLPTLRSL